MNIRQASRPADGLVLALTGAGISAESGIPTFRGKEGYWTVGSKQYHPQELATRRAFGEIPLEVWRWYLYRRGVCRAAEPNPGHLALARLARALESHFVLVTQNVDGLHLRAGNHPEQTYQVHGNIDFMRCSAECTSDAMQIPDAMPLRIPMDGPASQAITSDQWDLLRCLRCGGLARPHILWFDECYDEPHYRFHSSLAATKEASLVLIVGTSASTNLPNQVVAIANEQGATIIDVNPEPDDFSEIARRSGEWILSP